MFDGDNPSYRAGAMWKTRTKIEACTENKEKIIMVPKGEIIFLLGYIIRPNYEENIQFLWNNKVLYAFDVDVGLDFIIDQNVVLKTLNPT